MVEDLTPLLDEAYHLRLAERQAAQRILRKKKNRTRLIELVDEAAGLAEMASSQHSTFAPACEAGCVWCCYQRVTATPAEVLRIVDYLHETLMPDEVQTLHERIRTVDAITRGLTPQERLRLRLGCPLLVEGRCAAYHVRPLTCRGYTSSDAAVCQHKLDHPEQHVRVEADPVRYLFCQGVLNGLNDGLAASGLESGMLELNAALHIALDAPMLPKEWLDGEHVFIDAEVELLPLSESDAEMDEP